MTEIKMLLWKCYSHSYGNPRDP